MENYAWLDKKTPRSVKQLKLWPENPRLNPDEPHIKTSDFAEDFISEDSDRASFLELVKSISKSGFRPYDPIIVWKEDDGHYYVAEGNRRILALKLLLKPSSAPKSIRRTIQSYSNKIDKEAIEKVKVNVAPSFEDAEWYINQRNNALSLQRTWSRIQQQRWILELYDKYDKDINVVSSKVNMTLAALEKYIRPLKIRDFVYDDEMKKHLTETEIQYATSLKFPITILERFFENYLGREKFKLEFNGLDVKYNAEKSSFFVAYADLIKKIINRETYPKNSNDKIDTRTITTNMQNILDNIPDVIEKINKEDTERSDSIPPVTDSAGADSAGTDSLPDNEGKKDKPKSSSIVKNDPDRPKLVLKIYHLESSSYRLNGLFDELKKISLSYKNVVSVSMRVFLDLALLEFIQTEKLESDIARTYSCNFKEVTLKKRLEYLKQNVSKLNQSSKNILARLLNPEGDFSIDVLNGFTHGNSTSYLEKGYLNRFWDFMFPLFQEILVINESE